MNFLKKALSYIFSVLVGVAAVFIFFKKSRKSTTPDPLKPMEDKLKEDIKDVDSKLDKVKEEVEDMEVKEMLDYWRNR